MRLAALSLVAAVSVAATPAFAAGEAGPYVGVAVTHDNLSGTSDAEGLGLNGVGGSVFAGYNVPLGEKLFAGVEANFNLASADIGDKVDGLQADHQYGASARLGYKLSDTAAFYGRAGYQRGRLSAYDTSVKTSASRDGLLLGAGVEANLSSNVALRVEYNHTQFYRDSAVDPVNTGIANNQAAVGLVFNF